MYTCMMMYERPSASLDIDEACNVMRGISLFLTKFA